MRISLNDFFRHCQYTDGPVYYYFDRKTYTICEKERMEDALDVPYVRYIPLFQVDEKALQDEFIQQYMYKGAWRKFQDSPYCFEEFMQRNNEWYHWWDFYKKSVYQIARQWCMDNLISFVDEDV